MPHMQWLRYSQFDRQHKQLEQLSHQRTSCLLYKKHNMD
jgi:hypothetical protein